MVRHPRQLRLSTTRCAPAERASRRSDLPSATCSRELAEERGALMATSDNPTFETTEDLPTRAMSDSRVISSRTGAVVVAHDQVSNAKRCVAALARELDVEDIVVVVNRPDLISTRALADLEVCVGSLVLNDRALGYGANLIAVFVCVHPTFRSTF